MNAEALDTSTGNRAERVAPNGLAATFRPETLHGASKHDRGRLLIVGG